jgi:hypothetical protein
VTTEQTFGKDIVNHGGFPVASIKENFNISLKQVTATHIKLLSVPFTAISTPVSHGPAIE